MPGCAGISPASKEVRSPGRTIRTQSSDSAEQCPGAQASPPAECYPMYTPLPPAKNHTIYRNYPPPPQNKLIRKYVLQHKIKTKTIIFYTKTQKNHTFSCLFKKNIVLLQPFLAHAKTFLPINNTINNQILLP